MGSMIKVAMVVAMVAGAMIATGTVAAADPIEYDGSQQYREAMDYFVPALGDWSAELVDTIDAMAVKPELAEDLPELAYRGKMLVFDLEGTKAPREVADAHETLVFAMGQLTEVAQIAADDPAGADLLMSRYEIRLNDARQEILVWLTAGIEVVELGQAPAVLVAGK